MVLWVEKFAGASIPFRLDRVTLSAFQPECPNSRNANL
jgi:hypothetical protein